MVSFLCIIIYKLQNKLTRMRLCLKGDHLSQFIDPISVSVPIAENLFLVRRLAKEGKVRIVQAEVINSARLWQTLAVLRTSLINVVIAAACTLGVSPQRFVSLYRNEKSRLQS